MTTIQVTFDIPEDLARDARELGILNEQMLIDLLQQEVDHRVMAMVNDEVHTYRSEKRQNGNPHSQS